MNAAELRQYLEDSESTVFIFKYVRMMDDEYRFAEIEMYSPDHQALANGEPARSAANLRITPEGLEVQGYSSSLKKGPANDDERNISLLLGIPELPDEDRW